jgi:response regulator RpfG family c-di-GMP phosphodiesterase
MSAPAPASTPVAQPAGSAAAGVRGALLFVDDEANILSALNRLFRPLGHRIFTANGGAQGLEVLEKEAIDVVVSDMRMPGMDGAAFLEQVASRWPDTIRLLLTGYADIGDTVAAINKGHIYRYMTKPWEDNDLCLTVQRALEQAHLRRERERLEELTRKQNEELKDLNANLESKVAARTEELRKTVGLLETAHAELRQSYAASVNVFAGLIEMRAGGLAGHGRRVAALARKLGAELKMSDAETQDLVFAALLHDVGKIGWPDALLGKPFSALSNEERATVMKHPALGQAALMALDPLHEAAGLIRAHHERHDGQGYPDRLQGEAIPLGARILAVVNDFDSLQLGTLASERLSPAQAREFIGAQRGKRYDPKVVDAFLALVAKDGSEAVAIPDRGIKSSGLVPGMVLARDLVTRDGMLLLGANRTLDAALIRKIQNFETTTDADLTIFVRQDAK